MNTLTRKILIVDNERHIRTLLQQALQKLTKAGIQLLTAEDGMQALKLIDTERPDLIFMDLMMPGLHGFDVCRLVKSDPRLHHTYIIILSARSQFVDRQMGSVVGADEYIVKPFDPIQIAERAQKILEVQTT